MMRSLYSAVTGLTNHQTKMDVIANNIANVNTVAYKSSRVIFQDIYSQTISPASASTTTTGGTNPEQIGLGVQVSISVVNTKGSSQYTGNALDLSIDGDGYFVLSDGGQTTYTRAGDFYTDADNYLVNSNGAYVRGYDVDTDGNLILDGLGNPIITNIYIDPAYYDVSISSNGQVIGLDETTNESVVLGQIILAKFSNTNGLEKTGDSAYRTTVNSGDPVYTTPGDGGSGSLNPGTLEMSNVDLTSQFADMIVTQRGFQANSRIITTTDEMLEEVVNMVR
ncbi:MAG: flagellar hook-basal body complex protein [Eubacteriales bacterium]|nr:flagellar hook-basal body complex protein [Eubacteriales bacterium]